MPNDQTINIEAERVIDAVRKLVRAKGRFHTEQNYKTLVDALDGYDAARRAPSADEGAMALPKLDADDEVAFPNDSGLAVIHEARYWQLREIEERASQSTGAAADGAQNMDELDMSSRHAAAPAGQHDATAGETLDQKAENALLWCYHRLKNSYGRLPFVEEAIAGLRNRAAEAVPAVADAIAIVKEIAKEMMADLEDQFGRPDADGEEDATRNYLTGKFAAITMMERGILARIEVRGAAPAPGNTAKDRAAHELGEQPPKEG